MNHPLQIGAVTLILLLAPQLSHAAEPPAQQWHLLVENALPFEGGNSRKATGRPNEDLIIDLPLIQGKPADGYAWTAAMPGLDHRVTVTRAEKTKDDTWEVDLAIQFDHAPPLFTGGTATYSLTLSHDGRLLSGTYSGFVTGLDAKERAALLRKLKLTDADLKRGLRTARVESITNLARRKPGEEPLQPIAVSGEAQSLELDAPLPPPTDSLLPNLDVYLKAATEIDPHIAVLAGGPHDPRLAKTRALQGIRALADRNAPDELEIAARAVRRFIETAVGEDGAGNGNQLYMDSLRTVMPFAYAYQQRTGRKIYPAELPQKLAEYARMFEFGESPGTPLPVGFGRIDTRNLRLTFIDRKAGAVATRSGWDLNKHFLLTMEMGSAAEQAAPMRGHFALHGLGREWILRKPIGEIPPTGWPTREQCNVLQIRASEATTRGAAINVGVGKLGNVRAARDGSASFSMKAGGFAGTTGSEDGNLESQSWRTLAVDYSGKSGSPALLALVEGNTGLEDRMQVWEIAVGNIPASQVRIDGLRFEIWPEGLDKGSSMAGTFIYPTTVFIEYAAPTKSNPVGRIKAYREKPGEKSLDAMMKKLDERLDGSIQAMLKDEDSNIDVSKFDLPLEDANTPQQQRYQRQNEIVYLKLLKETSSVKMGAPDRKPKAKGNWVVILTVQEGPGPKVEVPGTDVEALAKVGPRTVTYREQLIEFGKP